MSKKKKHKKKHQKHNGTAKKHNAAALSAGASEKNKKAEPDAVECDVKITAADAGADTSAPVQEDIEDTAAQQTETDGHKQKKKRRFPVFWVLYLLFIAAFCVALWFGVRFLTGVLAEYEAVQPEYAAEDVFSEHFAHPDIERLLEMTSTEYALFETHEKVIEYLTSQIAEKEITYSESSAAGEEGIFTYNVFCGGARFAVFRIEQGPDATEHGFPIYVLKDVRLTFSLPDNAYSFLIPDGYTLYANGVEVPRSFISGEPVPTEAYRITSGELGVRYIPYRVDGFLSTPEFEVKDRDGADCGYEYDEDKDLYHIDAESITIRLPEGYTPYFGEHAVDIKYMAEGTSEPSVYNSYLREGASPVNYVSYTVNGFIDMPEVTVKNTQGVVCGIRFDEKTRTYESLPAYDEKMQAEHEQWILRALEKLTLYLQLVPGTQKDDVIGYFDTSSDIWRAYAEMNPDWNYEAYSYDFENESVSDLIVYDDAHFSCRVTMHYIGYRGSGRHEDITDKIVFFRRIGSRYYIYNMVNREAVSGLGMFDVQKDQ